MHNIQTGSGAQLTSYSIDTEVSFPWSEFNHSPPSSAEVKNGGAVPPLPDTSSSYGA
jgi:hypothetical protein